MAAGIDAIPSRPSGMQRKTYNNLRAELEIIERKLILYRSHPRRERRNYAFQA